MTSVSPGSSVPLLCPNAIDRTAALGSLVTGHNCKVSFQHVHTA